MKQKSLAILVFLLVYPLVTDAQQVDWTFLKGYGDLAYYPVYGTQGEAAAANRPGRRLYSMSWSAGGKFYIFGGSGLAETNSGLLNDLWEYNPATNYWKWIKGSKIAGQMGTYGIQGVASDNNCPGARVSGVTWVNNGKLYVYGGKGFGDSKATGLLSDLWEFDISTGNWRWLKGSSGMNQLPSGEIGVEAQNSTPGAREEAVGWQYGSKLYLFGGSVRTSMNTVDAADLWVYDLVTNNWVWIKGSLSSKGVYGTQGVSSGSNMPGSRTAAASFQVEDKLYMFGGSNYGLLMNDLWVYNPGTNEWTWLKGTNGTGQSGVYGSVGEASPENTPGGRRLPSYWTRNGKLYLYGGESLADSDGRTLRVYSDLWEYNPASGNWKWIKGSDTYNAPDVYGKQGIASSTNMPGARLAASTAQIGDSLYLFGGYSYYNSRRSEARNDVWAFDLKGENWTWVNGSNYMSQFPVYGVKGIETELSKPGAMDIAASWTSEGRLYVFGGANGNELWSYNPSSNNWTWASGSAEPGDAGSYGIKGQELATNLPSGRTSSSTWSVGNNLYLFGGRRSVGTNVAPDNLNDLWVYNTDTGSWTWLSGSDQPNQPAFYGDKDVVSAGAVPGARYGASSWTFNGKLYLYGGVSVDKSRNFSLYSDLWEYDLQSNSWKWLAGENTANAPAVFGIMGQGAKQNTPGVRFKSGTWEYNGRLYLFGGEGIATDGQGVLNDVWEFNLISKEWRWLKGNNTKNPQGSFGQITEVSASNVPPARLSFAACAANGKFYLMGGNGVNIENRTDYSYNDLWEYDVTANNWVWLEGSTSINPRGYYTTEGQSNAPNTPGGRQLHASWYYNNKLYVFGGLGTGVNGDFNNRADLWVASLNTVLPLNLAEFNAKKEAGRVRLDWRVTGEPATEFIIERSSDGATFQTINNTKGKEGNPRYTFYDSQPAPGTNYYRLKAVGADGKTEVLALKSLDFSIGSNASFTVFPVPFSKDFNIKLSGKSGFSDICLYDLGGRLVYNEKHVYLSPANVHKVNLPVSIPSGEYVLQIQGSDSAVKMIVLKK